MSVRFIELFFTAMRLAETIDRVRLANDEEYRAAVIRELCGEPEPKKPDAGKPVANDTDIDTTLPRAA